MSQTEAEIRSRIVKAAKAAVTSKSHWTYAEVRPIPYTTFNEILDGKGGTIKTDCSGLATCCYFRAGAADPNNENYNGQGFTGTMLSHLPSIPLSHAQPGDLAVFGAFPGVHVVVIVGTGTNPLCVSHGKQGDPTEAPLSNYLGLGTLHVLRGVTVHSPPPTAKHVVVGDHGKVVGHVYRRTRFQWYARHLVTCKRQRDNLAFHRIQRATSSDTNPAVDK